jgi:RNA polymerase sigma-70 factor (ECF subfamily)
MKEPSDEDLAARWRAGDQAAARVLLERYSPRLRGRARRGIRGGVRRRVGESDAIQEAYLTAFLRLDDFRDLGPGSFAKWVGKILDHKVRDEVRRHVGSSRRDLRVEARRDVASSDAPARGGTPSAVAQRHDELDLARAAMASLPARQREAIRLVHEQRLTLAQVGECLGCSTEAASMVYARALGRLAERIRRAGRGA